MNTTEQNILKEKTNLELFNEFWEKAREWKDEDGDNFLTWDKSIIGQFCFIYGKDKGYQLAQKEMPKCQKCFKHLPKFCCECYDEHKETQEKDKIFKEDKQ